MVERTCTCGNVVLCKSIHGRIPCRACKPSVRCEIGDCDREVRARGLCITHYTRWRRRGDPLVTLPGGRPPQHMGCLIADCPEPHDSEGFCPRHARAWQRHGDPLWTRPARPTDCSFDGCGNPRGPRAAKGYCITHYKRLRKYGDARGVTVACGACGLAFFPVNSLRALCDTCGGSRHHGSSALELADRDGPWCKLCGVPVDFAAAYPDPWSGSVDHIIPWSRGGAHDPANLQLAHLICNIRKSNRVDVAARTPLSSSPATER